MPTATSRLHNATQPEYVDVCTLELFARVEEYAAQKWMLITDSSVNDFITVCIACDLIKRQEMVPVFDKPKSEFPCLQYGLACYVELTLENKNKLIRVIKKSLANKKHVAKKEKLDSKYEERCKEPPSSIPVESVAVQNNYNIVIHYRTNKSSPQQSRESSQSQSPQSPQEQMSHPLSPATDDDAGPLDLQSDYDVQHRTSRPTLQSSPSQVQLSDAESLDNMEQSIHEPASGPLDLQSDEDVRQRTGKNVDVDNITQSMDEPGEEYNITIRNPNTVKM